MASSNAVVVGNEDLGIDALYGSADPSQTLTITYEDNTMYDANFEVLDMDEDGFPLGRLVSVNVLSDGLISAYYSNNQTQPLGRIALASFNNEQGLMKVGNSSWVETLTSGEAISGEARTASFGDIKSSFLELSNVDLSDQMIDLIVAQRNYQANSKAIEADNTANSSILGIR
jgi:flagellar hook protein FlgE